MTSEWEFVVEEFKKNFAVEKQKKIVLYGVGKHTKSLLDAIENDGYHIVGLMDAEKQGTEMWGYDVLSYQGVLDKRADMIVIIARPSVHDIIYQRIKEFVMKNNIPVYNIQKKLMRGKKHIERTNIPYFEEDINSLLNKIDGADTISFDIFDTLIMRKVLYPTDVFKIVEKLLQKKGWNLEYVQERISAEQKLKKNGYPNIFEIYDEMAKKCKLTESEMEELIHLEVETEKKVLVQRTQMVECLKYCKDHNKNVFLISDMYLTGDILTDLLHGMGIDGFLKIYVSCDYGVSKSKGLFDIYKKDVNGSKYLHIGDDLEKDIESASADGIDTYHIFSANELLYNSTWHFLSAYTGDLLERTLLALVINRLFNSPFKLAHSNGRPKISSSRDTAYVFLAPLFFVYLLWVLKKISKEAVSDIIFVARDGFLPFKCYKEIRKKLNMLDTPVGHYIYLSGRAIMMANLRNPEDLANMLEEYRGTPKQMVEELFVLPVEKSLYEDQIDCRSLAYELKDVILKEAEKERTNYLLYLKNESINFDNKVLYLDFFSKGTGQLNLEKLVGHPLCGMYCNRSYSSSEAKNSLCAYSLFESKNHYETELEIVKFYSFIEFVFSSPEPCFIKMENGKKVFYEEERSDHNIETMKEMQKEVTFFCNDIINILGEAVIDCMKTEKEVTKFCDDILALSDKKYSDIYADECREFATYEWARGAWKIVGNMFE